MMKMDDSSTCPFCLLSLPSSQIQWHANTHNTVLKAFLHRPLYFQHDGQSRTIVGIQVKHQRNGNLQYNLLVLDHAHKTAALERSLRQKVGWQRLIKRGVHTLKKQQYQLCYVDPGVANKEEMEKLKTMDSVFLEL